MRSVSLALTLALAIGSAGQIPPAQAAPVSDEIVDVSFELDAYPDSPPSICVGQKLRFDVLVIRRVYKVSDSTFPYHHVGLVSGVRVSGSVENTKIGTVSPPMKWTLADESSGDFWFLAKKAGTTTLNFKAEIGTYWLGAGAIEIEKKNATPIKVGDKVNVTVRNCKLKASMIYQGYGHNALFFNEAHTTYLDARSPMGNFYVDYTGWMDEVELTFTEEQHYIGSGTFSMNFSVVHEFPGCPLSHTTHAVETTITAVLNEYTLSLAFDSEEVEVFISAQCPGTYSASFARDSWSLSYFAPVEEVTLPPEGGVVNVPSNTDFPGTFTIIVTREAEE